uniref:Uncharacterized protein n=1 Tax=Strombidium rassoulzadegani TaxID=1082188 RepID=A0A7S3CJR8_9SPIT|mmetsp:Transcript_13504/g.22998  ORF Transcript_13504/g.22998 Transcript_13504/m.22998 type:complete len:407 (+) Transcript_13504:192-1412(+)
MMRKKDKMQLGWHFLTDSSGTDRCKFVSYHFLYQYDNLKGCFRLLSDVDSYTVGEMVWDFIEEYNIYNITLKELQTVTMSIDPFTGQEIFTENPVVVPNLPKDVAPPMTFDVSRRGEFMGMPRIKDHLTFMYKELGIQKIEKLRKEQKEAYCNFIDNQMRFLWEGLVEQWIDYKAACLVKRKRIDRLAEQLNLGIEASEELLQNEVPVFTIFKETIDEPHVLRKFFDTKLETDYFYKQKSIQKASYHPNVKLIHNILDRDEQNLDHNDPEIAMRKGSIKWEDKSTKYLDLHKQVCFKTQVLQEDFRPLWSEQINSRKIIFTLDDKYVAYDIRGDNKLVFLEWKDMPDLHDTSFIVKRIKRFKEKNLKVIDGLKSKLVREKLYVFEHAGGAGAKEGGAAKKKNKNND